MIFNMKLFNLNLMVALVSFSSAFAAEPKAVGQLSLIEGEVLLDQHPVKKNASVREGAVIEVKSGKATLLLGKGSVFHLAANTKMVVNQFGIQKDSKREGGELDLKFGRTRALILNQGNEKRDLKIKARAATMGVRGTEIYIDAPRDSSAPVQFFTLEGQAEVKTTTGGNFVPLNQNQGVATEGASRSVGEVKNEIKSAGMEVKSASAVQDQKPDAGNGNPPLNGTIGINSIPQPQFDPIQDSVRPINLQPNFCNATSGTCP